MKGLDLICILTQTCLSAMISFCDKIISSISILVFSDFMVFSSFGHGYNVFTLNAATCCNCLAA